MKKEYKHKAAIDKVKENYEKEDALQEKVDDEISKIHSKAKREEKALTKKAEYQILEIELERENLLQTLALACIDYILDHYLDTKDRTQNSQRQKEWYEDALKGRIKIREFNYDGVLTVMNKRLEYSHEIDFE